MLKASRWFRGLIGLNKKPTDPSSSFSNSPSNPSSDHKPQKRKFNFTKIKYHRLHTNNRPTQNVNSDKHAAGEAAVAAVQAAAEVVGLTTSSALSEAHVNGRSADYGILKEESAVTKIQSHFRAYLARRALRALKALVKIQALVRGYIVRKRTSDSMSRVQALLRLQARARLRQSQILECPYSPLKNTRFKQRNGSRSNGKSAPTGDERIAKILEVDQATNAVRECRNLFHSCHPTLSSDSYNHASTSNDSTAHQAIASLSSEVQSFGHQKLVPDLYESCHYASDHSIRQLYPASSKGGRFSLLRPVTPTKSDGSKSCLSGNSDSPSYMSYTESSKAKIRSVSAPRQRPQFDRSSSTKRYSVHNDSKLNPLKVSGLQANFANKAYPGSGRLDRLGMPIGGRDAHVFCGGHWRRV